MKRHAIFIAMAGVVAALLLTYGCTRRESSGEEPLSYSTPDEAVAALVAALEKHDVQELKRVLGPGTDELVASGDDVADRAAREAFLARYREQHRFVAGSPGDVVLQVGANEWPLPIPLVREQGRWRFDGEAGADEIVARRIGANELAHHRRHAQLRGGATGVRLDRTRRRCSRASMRGACEASRVSTMGCTGRRAAGRSAKSCGTIARGGG